MPTLVTQRRTIVDATIGTFFDLVAAQRDVHNRDLTVQALQDQLQSAQARYNLGTVTKGDVLQAQSALDSAVADQSSSQLSLQEFRARFAAVLGKDAQSLSPVAVEPGQAATLGQSTTDVLQLTQKADPRVTALHAQTVIAQQTLAVARAEHQITVNLVVGGGARIHGTGGDDSLKPYYDVSVNVALPILDTAAYKNTVQSDKDEIQLRQLDEDQYNLTSKADDLSVGLAYQSASARVLPATSAVANAEEAYRLREGQYNIGTATQEQVVSSFATLTTRRNDLANVLAQRDLAARRIMLNEGTVNIESLDTSPPSILPRRFRRTPARPRRLPAAARPQTPGLFPPAARRPLLRRRRCRLLCRFRSRPLRRDRPRRLSVTARQRPAPALRLQHRHKSRLTTPLMIGLYCRSSSYLKQCRREFATALLVIVDSFSAESLEFSYSRHAILAPCSRQPQRLNPPSSFPAARSAASAAKSRPDTAVSGIIRKHKRTKTLVKRLRPGDIALIDHTDLRRGSRSRLSWNAVRRRSSTPARRSAGGIRTAGRRF